MAWGKQTDSFHIDPDIDQFEIPVAALGLFWCMISYCNRNLTDGVIPRTAVPKLPGGDDRKNIAKLIEAGWVVPQSSGSLLIRSFLKYNASRKAIERQRAWARTRRNVAAIVIARDRRCVYCGAEDDLTIDHVVPQSRNGSDDISNLVAACRGCNSSKGAKGLEDWR